MACGVCGASNELLFECRYCGGAYCPEHRLPEGHDCDGVRFSSDPGKRFESKFSGEVVEKGEGIEPPEPFKPKCTVGTTPEPEWGNPSPETKLKSAVEEKEPPSATRESSLQRLLRWWNKARPRGNRFELRTG